MVEVGDGHRVGVVCEVVHGVGPFSVAAEPEVVGGAVIVGAIDGWSDWAVRPGAGSARGVGAVKVRRVEVLVEGVREWDCASYQGRANDQVLDAAGRGGETLELCSGEGVCSAGPESETSPRGSHGVG